MTSHLTLLSQVEGGAKISLGHSTTTKKIDGNRAHPSRVYMHPTIQNIEKKTIL